MSKRFFIEPTKDFAAGDEVILDGPEAHHLIHVMRASAGDVATLFDGTGREFVASIVEVERKRVLFELVEANEIDRELGFDLTIAIALPKADRQKVLVEKLVELGVARVIPLITDRTVVIPKSNSLVRLERTVIEASKQCGRNRLMKIEVPQLAATLFATDQFADRKLIASTVVANRHSNLDGREQCCAIRDVVENRASNDVDSFAAAIGPEGGFTDTELSLAIENDWKAVSLGNRILRAETAAIAVAAFIANLLQK